MDCLISGTSWLLTIKIAQQKKTNKAENIGVNNSKKCFCFLKLFEMLQSVLLFFNIGTPELFVIILVIIMFFGSKKIPELARGLGKGIREVKNATSDIQEEIRKTSTAVKDEINITKDINSKPRSSNKDS